MEQCEEGLKISLSFLAWDLMSRIHEANRDLADCVKCMKMAIMKDPKSDRAMEMRTKMAMVQFAAGDFAGFLETTSRTSRKTGGRARWGRSSWATCPPPSP